MGLPRTASDIPKAVIYARYSSDAEREESIEDQVEVSQRYITLRAGPLSEAVVEVIERNPPEGVEPGHWRLLTTHTVVDLARWFLGGSKPPHFPAGADRLVATTRNRGPHARICRPEISTTSLLPERPSA